MQRVRVVLQASLIYLFLALVMKWGAGNANLAFVWLVFGTQAVLMVLGSALLSMDLLNERLHPKGQDHDPFGPLFVTTLVLLQLVIILWDLGHAHLSDNVPAGVKWFAYALQTAGWLGILWSMWVNRFFSSAIRLQPDRGQVVIASGPYQYIRHPGYGFAALAFFTQGVAMGSWLSILPVLPLILLMVRRTLMEEALLAAQLPGYAAYQQSVRFRWIPGIW